MMMRAKHFYRRVANISSKITKVYVHNKHVIKQTYDAITFNFPSLFAILFTTKMRNWFRHMTSQPINTKTNKQANKKVFINFTNFYMVKRFIIYMFAYGNQN